jgi:predicted nuclease of restriction endonuclease-like RecB superfamily
VLTKDLLRVSRAGADYRPRFVDGGERALAARLLDVYRDHVGEERATLDGTLEEIERDHDDHKLVRGFAKLLDRDATFETRAPVPPARVRRETFAAAERVGVVTAAERDRALADAADRLGVDPAAVETALYADRDARQVLVAFEPRWDPETLQEQYDLSLAQTALFDATEVRIRSADPKRLVSAAKRNGLLYEVRRTDAGRELVVTGPDALFRRTRRYGTAFARLLRSVAASHEWTLTATIDDRGTERTLRLSDGDVSVPGVEPVAEPTYDSGVEADFAARFDALDLDWTLTREPAPLAAGDRVMIPDFAFDYEYADFRVFFEVMGFWTPEYVTKKLDQVAAVEGVELVVAVDESLGVGDDLDARGARVVPYSGTVRVKDVVDVLRTYEADLVERTAADLPDQLTPEADVVSLEELAREHGVSADALDGVAFPDHEQVGRTLVRPAVLDDLAAAVEAGMDYAAVEALLDERGIADDSAVLSRLGYRVEWEGLSGGTVVER